MALKAFYFIFRLTCEFEYESKKKEKKATKRGKQCSGLMNGHEDIKGCRLQCCHSVNIWKWNDNTVFFHSVQFNYIVNVLVVVLLCIEEHSFDISNPFDCIMEITIILMLTMSIVSWQLTACTHSADNFEDWFRQLNTELNAIYRKSAHFAWDSR